MHAQVLDVEDGEFLGLEDRAHLREARRVAPGEDAPLDPGVVGGRRVAPDGVDEAPSVGLERARRHLAEGAVVVDAHVLQHADRDERVVLALDGAVVGLHELDLLREAEPRRAFACVPDLLVGDVERPHLRAVFTRHVNGERAPAAPRLHHPLPGPERELPADVVHLGPLGLLEGGVLVRVVRARVDHLLVEPEPVEIVAEVVVVVDVGLRAGPGIPAGPVEPRLQTALPGVARDRRVRRAIDGLEGGDEIPVDPDAIRAHRIPEHDVGIDEEPVEGAPVPDLDPGHRLRPRAGRIGGLETGAVPELDHERRVARLGEDQAREPTIDRSAPTSRVGPSFPNSKQRRSAGLGRLVFRHGRHSAWIGKL